MEARQRQAVADAKVYFGSDKGGAPANAPANANATPAEVFQQPVMAKPAAKSAVSPSAEGNTYLDDLARARKANYDER